MDRIARVITYLHGAKVSDYTADWTVEKRDCKIHKEHLENGAVVEIYYVRGHE